MALIPRWLMFTAWLGGQIACNISWQDSGTRYIEGGLRFVADTLAWLERNFAFAARRGLFS